MKGDEKTRGHVTLHVWGLRQRQGQVATAAGPTATLAGVGVGGGNSRDCKSYSVQVLRRGTHDFYG